MATMPLGARVRRIDAGKSLEVLEAPSRGIAGAGHMIATEDEPDEDDEDR